MKKFFISLLILIFIALLMINFYGKNLSEIDQMREEVNLQNYNVKVKENEYTLTINKVKTNMNEIKEYLMENIEELDFLTDAQLSDVDYFKQIMKTNSGNKVKDALNSLSFFNYQFLDSNNNIIIDYYNYSIDGKVATLELQYKNNEVIDTSIY